MTINEEEEALLSLPPKYAVFEKVKEGQCESEIEKCLAKLRWEDKDDDNTGNEEETQQLKWHDQETKTMDFRKYRSTNLPFNSRIIVPKPLEGEKETQIQTLKERLNQCTKEYIKESTKNDNKTKMNLTTVQKQGLESLKKKTKNREIVIFETDKSKRFSCDTTENYKKLGETHITNDEVVTSTEQERFEKEINAHAEMWTRMLNAGKETGHHDRIRASMKSKNNPSAPLSVLRKDHKQYDDEVTGPPGRPVCGGDVSYNKRLSHLISTILNDVYIGEKTVCSSTEELLAEIDRVNQEGVSDEDICGSMDVEALYPKLQIDFTVEKVGELLYESRVEIKGLDYKEISLYLSLTKTDAELQQLGLQEVCPRRRARRGPRPNITGCGVEENKEKRYKPWIFPDISQIDESMKRKMFTEAMKVVLKTLLETHTYDFAGEIRRQKEGGAIGMEITGVIAQIFMVWWDKQYNSRLSGLNINLKLHERYVDDTNLVTKQTEKGARYEDGRITVTEESRQEDEDVPDDERTMKILQKIANEIHPSIRMTIDYPSKYEDNKVPMLDLKISIKEINGEKKLLYEHYEKKMATKSVIHADSAIPEKTKRTVLTQEMLRIMLHCNEYVPQETINEHFNNFMKKLQYSGYDKAFRHDIVKSAKNAFRIIKENDQRGIRPRNRPKNWNRKARNEEKEKKKRDWYKQGGFKSVLFIPTTPDGRLKKMYEKTIRESGIKVKIVERTGKTLKSQLQRSNPFKTKECGRRNCFVCTTTTRGNCRAESVTYRIECNDEGCGMVYNGETSGNAYTRGKKHLTDLAAKDASNSPLWRHCINKHAGTIQTFKMSVTGTFRNDAMLRQITEAVQIGRTNDTSRMNDRAEWNRNRVPRNVITI